MAMTDCRRDVSGDGGCGGGGGGGGGGIVVVGEQYEQYHPCWW